jgi:hypothetical protein
VELEMIKELFSLAIKNPAYIMPALIVFVVFLVFIAGKNRAKILEAIFDKVPFGKTLEKWYKKGLKEELVELDRDDMIDSVVKKEIELDPNINNCPDPNQNQSNYKDGE